MRQIRDFFLHPILEHLCSARLSDKILNFSNLRPKSDTRGVGFCNIGQGSQIRVQSGSDWPQMGKIRDFFRSDFHTFSSWIQIVLKSDLKKSRISPIWCQLWPTLGQNLISLTYARLAICHGQLLELTSHDHDLYTSFSSCLDFVSNSRAFYSELIEQKCTDLREHR